MAQKIESTYAAKAKLRNETKIAKFLNQTEEDEDYALIFHKELKEEEIEMQIELSN